jgi:cobalamin biosynthesis protein CobT
MSAYKQTVLRLKPVINRIQGFLRFRATVSEDYIRELEAGELDDDALCEVAVEKKPRIWRRMEAETIRPMAICLLVDMSGSMSGGVKVGNVCSSRIEQARDVCIALYEALKTVKGIDLMVIGHTADADAEHVGTIGYKLVKVGGSTDDGLSMIEFIVPEQNDPQSLMCILPIGNNADSFAMAYCIKRLSSAHPSAPERLLFVISDGQPSCRGLSGTPAMRHMRMVSEWGRLKHGVKSYGIGVASAYSDEDGDMMYGHGNYTVIADVMNAAPIIGRFVRKVALKG